MRRTAISMTAGAGLACALAAAAFAQAGEAEILDAKCLTLGGLLQRAPETKEVGAQISMFFLGRVSMRGKVVDLDKTLTELRPEVAGGIGPMRDKCAAVFNGTQKLLKASEPPRAPAPK